jgi:hypothetical protein
MSEGEPRIVADSLLQLGAGQATGMLALARGQVRKRLFLRAGQLIAAESDLREEALGAVLVALGMLGKSRLPALLAEVRRRGQKMGAVLVDLGWASADDVLAALGEQVRRRAKSCLRWPESDATFTATDSFVGSVIEYPQALPPLVFTGLCETASVDRLLPALDSPVPGFVALLPRFGQHRDDFVAVFGAPLLERVAARPPLHDLAVDPEAPRLLEALDVLLSCGLGRLEGDAPALARVGVVAAAEAQGERPAVPGGEIDRIGAELAFFEGRAAFQSGHARAALPHLQRAIELRPDQAAYHAWLGSVLFRLRGPAALPEARDRLEHALALDPDSSDAHVLLAELLLALGERENARVHLERTLALRPEQPRAIDALLELVHDEPREHERILRRLLVALGERARPLRRRLWRALAVVYGQALHDAAAAARAEGMADALGPDDADPFTPS